MDLTSTPFLSYRDIKTEGIDLLEDAWGFYPQFHDLIDAMKLLRIAPGKRLTARLLRKIRNQITDL